MRPRQASAGAGTPELYTQTLCCPTRISVFFFLPHSSWSGVRTGHSSRLTIFKSETVCTDRRAPKSMWLVRNRLKLKGLGAEKHVVSEERAQVEGAGGREEKKQPLPQFLNSITQLENWMAGVPESPPDPLSPKNLGKPSLMGVERGGGEGDGTWFRGWSSASRNRRVLVQPSLLFPPFYLFLSSLTIQV